jgi:hypothetical protein
MRWHYQIPADRAALRTLLQPVLAFENEVLLEIERPGD